MGQSTKYPHRWKNNATHTEDVPLIRTKRPMLEWRTHGRRIIMVSFRTMGRKLKMNAVLCYSPRTLVKFYNSNRRRTLIFSWMTSKPELYMLPPGKKKWWGIWDQVLQEMNERKSDIESHSGREWKDSHLQLWGGNKFRPMEREIYISLSSDQ